MTKLIEEDIERRLSQLIHKDSLETAPFRESLGTRRLLWIFGLRDDGNEIDLVQGILKASKSRGEHKLFVKLLGDPSYFDVHGNFHKRPQYYQYRIEKITDYYQDDLIQGSARIVFSQSEDWLLIITFDGYALLGAKNALMKKIETSVVSLSEYYNLQDFIDYWQSIKQRNGVEISWVGKLLNHANLKMPPL